MKKMSKQKKIISYRKSRAGQGRNKKPAPVAAPAEPRDKCRLRKKQNPVVFGRSKTRPGKNQPKTEEKKDGRK